MGKQEDLVAAVKDHDLSTVLKLTGKVAKSSKLASSGVDFQCKPEYCIQITGQIFCTVSLYTINLLSLSLSESSVIQVAFSAVIFILSLQGLLLSLIEDVHSEIAAYGHSVRCYGNSVSAV